MSHHGLHAVASLEDQLRPRLLVMPRGERDGVRLEVRDLAQVGHWRLRRVCEHLKHFEEFGLFLRVNAQRVLPPDEALEVAVRPAAGLDARERAPPLHKVVRTHKHEALHPCVLQALEVLPQRPVLAPKLEDVQPDAAGVEEPPRAVGDEVVVPLRVRHQHVDVLDCGGDRLVERDLLDRPPVVVVGDGHELGAEADVGHLPELRDAARRRLAVHRDLPFALGCQ
mmetsp:Transcript_32428/g.100309  ORF Transcript_32428/g.100309 Transcript_32428/m.100309 type:complete len:225 (-) Transcript_32428:707-1381(-)